MCTLRLIHIHFFYDGTSLCWVRFLGHEIITSHLPSRCKIYLTGVSQRSTPVAAFPLPFWFNTHTSQHPAQMGLQLSSVNYS